MVNINIITHFIKNLFHAYKTGGKKNSFGSDFILNSNDILLIYLKNFVVIKLRLFY